MEIKVDSPEIGKLKYKIFKCRERINYTKFKLSEPYISKDNYDKYYNLLNEQRETYLKLNEMIKLEEERIYKIYFNELWS